MTDPAALHAQAVAAFNRRDWRQLREMATRLLSLAPGHAGAHYLAGTAALELRQLSRAIPLLRRAVELDPARADVAAQLARALVIVRASAEARTVADRALALTPLEPATLDALGGVYAQTQAHERAATAFRQAVALAPAHVPYRFNLATALVATGEVDAAENELEACLVENPKYWRAHLALAHLRLQAPDKNHLARLQALLPQCHGDGMAQVCLNLALAKEYEDLADYPRAFDHLVSGKAASREGLDYSIRQDEALFAALERAFPPSRATPAGCPSREAIFVFGLPRTGTTLVERIISSHPQVSCAGELQDFGMALQRAWGRRAPLWLDPDVAAHVGEIDWRQVGADYLSSVHAIAGHTPRFVDKLPHNFLYAGFIASALPNATMICLRRDPLDTCLSNFRQLFAGKLPYYNYSFDLLDTGRYYILFDRLMAHWQRVFPGRILEVQYESLVGAQEACSRQLLEHCGLSWNDACLHFESNPAPVATASALQVRAPIHGSAIGRWKNYATQLARLQELLTDAGIRITH